MKMPLNMLVTLSNLKALSLATSIPAFLDSRMTQNRLKVEYIQ